jgi:FMN phosphatase YigB (HAD superfamily)
MPIKKIIAFDFDDTLAHTVSTIGIRHVLPDRTSDKMFEDFLLDNNIQYLRYEYDFWWLDSANFALFEELPSPEVGEYEIDYSGTASIDMELSKGIGSMLDKLAEAQDDPESLALVITARAGNKEMYSPAQGANIIPQNRKQIIKFLNDNGIDISEEQLYTVGDMEGESPAGKATVLAGYLDRYTPEELIFYDDSERNVRAVAQLCKQYSPNVKISAYKVVNGSASSPETCSESIKDRLRKILMSVLRR